MKKCTVCKELKDIENFTKQAQCKDGLRPHCNMCQKEKAREYQKKHKEEIKQRNKEWYRKNIKYFIEYISNHKQQRRVNARQYYINNKAKLNEYSRQYYKNKEINNMAGRTFNIKLDDERFDRLNEEVLKSKSHTRPMTKTQIIKEALDMRWERQGTAKCTRKT